MVRVIYNFFYVTFHLFVVNSSVDLLHIHYGDVSLHSLFFQTTVNNIMLAAAFLPPFPDHLSLIAHCIGECRG